MPIGAAIGGLSSLGSALIGSGAAQQASQQQQEAAQRAQMTQLMMYNNTQSQLQPYLGAGKGAIYSLDNIYGIAHPGGAGIGASTGGQSAIDASMANFSNTPDYKFAFDQGEQAMDRSAAASGQLLTGGQLKASQQYGQGLASQQFGNYYNRLLSLAQIGQGATNTSAGVSTNVANSLAGLQTGAGSAAASGTVGSANALTGGLSNLGLYGALGTGALGNQGNMGTSSYGAVPPASSGLNNWNIFANSGGSGSGNGWSLMS